MKFKASNSKGEKKKQLACNLEITLGSPSRKQEPTIFIKKTSGLFTPDYVSRFTSQEVNNFRFASSITSALELGA